jgi:hypothetical protein
MRKFAGWLGKNIDGIVALIAALGIVVLDVASNLSRADKASVVNGGILLVLGVLAVAMLRDRARGEEADTQMRASIDAAAALVPAIATMQAELARVSKSLDDSSMVQVLGSAEIHQAHADNRQSTDRWLFRGGTGTYIRAKTLKGCVDSARRRRRPLVVRLEIIDPTNEEVCDTYARFRRSLSSDQVAWTTDRTRHESYATVMYAAWHRQRYELLDIEVGLSAVMPTLRWDLSQKGLLITHEGPRGLALQVEAGRLLYDYTQTELRKSFEQARRVPLEHARHVTLSDEITVDEAEKLFEALDMPLPSSYIDADVEDIVQRCLHAEDPYDR